MDLGLNISDELKDLKENLEAYRCFYSIDIFNLLLDSEIKVDNQNEFTRIYTHTGLLALGMSSTMLRSNIWTGKTRRSSSMKHRCDILLKNSSRTRIHYIKPLQRELRTEKEVAIEISS